MDTIAERGAAREQAYEARVFHLHGDAVDDYLPCRWSEAQSGWCCRVCDLVADAAHFKAHSRRENVRAFWSSLRTFARLAARGPVQRGGDADDNLVERGLLRESARGRLGEVQPEPERRSLFDELGAEPASLGGAQSEGGDGVGVDPIAGAEWNSAPTMGREDFRV